MSLDPLEQAPPSVAGPQAEAAITPLPTPPSAPPVLDAEQRALLKRVLNCIVPARPGLPGAGDLDVGAAIERTLATSARLRRLILDGLARTDIVAQRSTGTRFAELDATSQTRVLEDVEQHWPRFFVALVEHTYRGYYTLPRVQ